MTAPKYALFEHERRFVVGASRIPHLDAVGAVLIEDRYLDGSRLRLRRNTAADGTVIFKLAKKYAGITPTSRPMTNLYLDAAEFDLLAHLPGRPLSKRRFRNRGGFTIDVFEGALAGLILAEIDADAVTVEAASMPAWAVTEVTDNPHYDGGSLAMWTSADLTAHRARYG